MERDLYKFRSKARIVAFVDLILSSMSLCICLIFFVGLVRITSVVSNNGEIATPVTSKNGMDLFANSNTNNKPENDDNTGNTNSNGEWGINGVGKSAPRIEGVSFVKLMWIFLALISIMTAVQILAAVRLLNATQIGKDPLGAMKLCRFWRRVCIFFTGLLVFNFLSSFRQRGENFFEVSFLMTSILIRIVALYIVQQFVNELDVAIVSTLPIRRHHHPTSSHLTPSFAGDNLAYAYGPAQYPVQMPMQMPSGAHAPPPKYEDVVKEPFKFQNDA